jgi:urease accessory protein
MRACSRSADGTHSAEVINGKTFSCRPINPHLKKLPFDHAGFMKQIPDERLLHTTGLPPRQHLLATLSLGFERDGDTTRLTQRDHFGPLRVQKPLYPEDPAVCHAILVHPPGGVVGGDELRIGARAGDHAHALLSTPGAAKWYRANGQVSRQSLQLEAGEQAAIEWLPQETILFNGADVVFDSTVSLQSDARYLGCEILCFGRTASGERFDQGRVRQRLTIRKNGKLLWLEQGSLQGGSTQMHSPLGLAGHTVCASLIAVGPPQPAALLQAIREQAMAITGGVGKFGATQMKSVMVVRYLGDASEVARQVMLQAWQQLRPALLGQPAIVPRIWNT